MALRFQNHCVLVFFILIAPFFVSNLDCLAQPLPLSFYNNNVKIELTQEEEDDDSIIKLDVRAPQSSKTSIFTLKNPARIVLELEGAHVSRNKSFIVKKAVNLREFRIGAHMSSVRLVLEFNSEKLPRYSQFDHSGLVTLLVSEKNEEHDPKIFTTLKEELSDENIQKGIWPLTRIRPHLPFELNVNLWNKTGFDTKDDSETEDDFSNHAELKTELKYKTENSIQVVAGAKMDSFNYLNGSDGESEFEVRPYNTYVDYEAEHYNLRVGNQIVRWGKADEISPLDNVNPEDYRDGIVRHRTERKIPVPMINLDASNEDVKVQGILAPWFRRSRINLYDDDWAVFGSSPERAPIAEDYPDHSLSNGTYGGRVSSTIDQFDFAVNFLSKTSDLPSLKSFGTPTGFSLQQDPAISQLVEFANQTRQPIGIEYNRKEIIGAEFETVWDSLGIRGDLAYINKDDFLNDELQAERHASFRWVLGVDHHSVDDFYFNLQIGQQIIENYDDSLLYYDHVNTNTYGEASQEFWDNNLKFGIRGLYEFSQEGHFHNPYLAVNFWEDFNFELGFEAIGGPDNSLTGFYENNDIGYLTLNAFL